MSRVTRRDFLKFGGAALAVAALSPASILAASSGMPVLMYHDIGYDRDDYSVSPALFASQMEWLHSNGFQAVLPAEAASLSEAQALRSVIITFDDGYASFIEYAYPVLREYGFKSVANIVASFMGTSMDNPWKKPLLSWDECRYLAGTGLVEIGCHSYGLHSIVRNAGSVSGRALAQDLERFNEACEKELGRRAEVLAWPFGLFNDKAVEVARKAGFKYLLTSNRGYLPAQGPYDEVPRMNINGEYGMALFSRLMKGM